MKLWILARKTIRSLFKGRRGNEKSSMDTLATQVERLTIQVEALADAVRVGPDEKVVSSGRDARDFRIAKCNLLLGICTSVLTLL